MRPIRSSSPLAILILVGAGGGLPSPATAAVYRCTSADAPPRFSQFPCGSGERLVLEPLHTVTIPALSDAERRLLDDLERQHHMAAERRSLARDRATGDAEANREARQAQCEAARLARTALEAKCPPPQLW